MLVRPKSSQEPTWPYLIYPCHVSSLPSSTSPPNCSLPATLAFLFLLEHTWLPSTFRLLYLLFLLLQILFPFTSLEPLLKYILSEAPLDHLFLKLQTASTPHTPFLLYFLHNTAPFNTLHNLLTYFVNYILLAPEWKFHECRTFFFYSFFTA